MANLPRSAGDCWGTAETAPRQGGSGSEPQRTRPVCAPRLLACMQQHSAPGPLVMHGPAARQPRGAGGGILSNDLFSDERGQATIFIPCKWPGPPCGSGDNARVTSRRTANHGNYRARLLGNRAVLKGGVARWHSDEQNRWSELRDRSRLLTRLGQSSRPRTFDLLV